MNITMNIIIFVVYCVILTSFGSGMKIIVVPESEMVIFEPIEPKDTNQELYFSSDQKENNEYSQQNGYCFSAITGPMLPGDKISIEGECRVATCQKDGIIAVKKCDPIPESPCGIEEADFTEPFPACCPSAKYCNTDY